MKEKHLQYHSSEIFYRVTGKGKPLVLIHGFGEDGNIWDKQVEFLKDHCMLIVPDLPGSGRSALIEDMSIEGMAEVIKAIMDIELFRSPLAGAEGATIAGHSMGGYITLAFAEKYPQLLSSFGLVHSSAYADSEEKKATRLKSIEFIKKNGAYEFLKATIRGLFGEEWSADQQAAVEGLIEKSRAFKDEAVIQYYRAMIARPDRSQILRLFNKPILFIIGEHDNAVPFRQSLQQCYLPDESHIHILRHSAHMGMWEETQKVNQSIYEFIYLNHKS